MTAPDRVRIPDETLGGDWQERVAVGIGRNVVESPAGTAIETALVFMRPKRGSVAAILSKALDAANVLARGNDRGRMSRSDERHVLRLIVGDAGAASPTKAKAKALTLSAFINAVLNDNALGPLVVSSLDDPSTLDAATLDWIGRRLPISAETRETFGRSSVRSDILALLFGDPVFLKSLVSGDGVDFPLDRFLKPDAVDEPTKVFVQKLLKRKSALIDWRWLSQWGLGKLDAADGLILYGHQPWFRATPLFDAAWYAARYGTGLIGWFENLRHYVEQGEALGLSPNPFLNGKRYAEANADLASGIRAGELSCRLEHMAAREAVEQRSSVCNFDTALYLGQVSAKAIEPHGSAFAHYVETGWKDGVQPNPCFDPLWYLRTYSHVATALEDGLYPNAFSHFVLEGEAQGLNPCAFFDGQAYQSRNGDMRELGAFGVFRHFWSAGRHEGRTQGDVVSDVVARMFPRRLPDSLDVWRDNQLVRLSGKPGDVLIEAKTPASDDLPSLLQVELRGTRPPGVRQAVDQILRAVGRPWVHIEAGGQQQIHHGDANRLYVGGRAILPGLPLREVRARSANVVGTAEVFRYVRVDDAALAAVLSDDADDLRSGFLAWFEFSAEELPPGRYQVGLEFVFGLIGEEQALVSTQTVFIDVHPRPRVADTDARIQVAMATYNPPLGPFKTQVESILADPDVHLVISDDASPPSGAASLAEYAGDPRVTIDSNPANTGFIINFERSLHMCSDAAEVILFSDQDDLWRPDKVRRLVEALEPDVSCAFSDMRIVTDKNEVISPTFWDTRRVHYFDPLTVGVANTVTGAASAFPASLKSLLTPFPRYTTWLYHDQWLSVLATAVGRVSYIDAPLYDYIQHGGNVLGFYGSRGGEAARWRHMVRALRRARRREEVGEREIAFIEIALRENHNLLLRFVMWNEALIRVPAWADDRVRRLAIEVLKALRGEAYDPVHLKREFGRLARRAHGEEGLLRIDEMLETLLLARHLVLSGVAPVSAVAAQLTDDKSRDLAFEQRKSSLDRTFFEKKVEPFEVARVVHRPGAPRINLFLPELCLGTFFGGYHSKISLITRLQERGVDTRLILVDEQRIDHNAVAQISGAFPELDLGLRRSEIISMGLRDRPLKMAANDAMLATTWWSAHIVEKLRRDLGRERFMYLVQEFEPFTFSMGTWYRSAEQTYDYPHDAVFSTDILQDFFRDQAMGVFRPGAAEARSLYFRNPITGLREIPREPLAGRRPRMLFYARPQNNESRNMYEFGLAALRMASRELGSALDGWDLVGVGADRAAMIDLGGGRSLRQIQKLPSYNYRQMLASSDVGLALMYTPHPSLVPLEMAAAGMVTVTNGCMSKTAESFAGISPLIRVADPSVEAIAAELVAAFRQVMAGPVHNPGVDWPVNPAQAFPDEWLDQFMDLAERSLRPG